MIQGQGATTEWKQDGIAAVLKINMQIANKVCGDRFPYFHFDITCGCGTNDRVGCIGSPIAFLRTARESTVTNWRAFFVDKELASIKQLHDHHEVYGQCYLFAGDNSSFVQTIPHIIRACGDRPHMAIGSLLCDPNGPTGIPCCELAWLGEVCPKIDIIVNWNATAAAMARGCCKSGLWSRGLQVDTASGLMEMLSKQYWIVRDNPYRSKLYRGHRFFLLVGRNVNGGEYTKEGFHKISSNDGRRIVSYIDGTSCECHQHEWMQQTLPFL